MTDKDDLVVTNATLVDSNGDVGEFPNLPSTVLKALFDEVTGKKEFHFSRLNKSYVIEREDIAQLCVKLGQWVDHLKPVSAGFRFVIVEDEDKSGAVSRENISSYQRFISHDFSSTKPISCFEIYFDFIVPSPHSEDGVGAYSLNLDLHGYVLKKSESNAMVGHEVKNNWSGSCAELRIEYVDYLVSRNLEMVVKDWFEALVEYDVPKRPKWVPQLGPNYIKAGNPALLQVNSFEQLRVLVFLAILAAMLAGNGHLWNINENYQFRFSNLIVLGMAYFTVTWLIHFLYVHISNNAWPRGYFPMLKLNKAGNRQMDRHQELIRKGRGWARELGYATVVSVASAIVISAITWIVKLIL